jgi:hypothetical protein
VDSYTNNTDDDIEVTPGKSTDVTTFATKNTVPKNA